MTLFGLLCAATLGFQPPTYDAGVEARLDGRFEEAVEILSQVAESQPGNADALLQLGLALSVLERFDEAEAAFRRVLDLAPEYTDARIGLARLAYYRGDLARAGDLAAPLPEDPQSRELRAQIAAAREALAPQTWRADVFYAHSTLSDPLSPWREAGVALGRRLGSDKALTGLVHWSRRFDDEDVYLSLNYALNLPDAGSAYLELGGAPQGDFRARAAVKGGYITPTAPGGNGVQGTIEASASQYQTGEVFSLAPGVRYLANADGLRLGLHGLIFLNEAREVRTGWAVFGEVRATDKARFITQYVDALDTESGRASPVQSISLGLRYQLTNQVGLYTAVVQQTRETYDRTEITISANRRF